MAFVKKFSRGAATDINICDNCGAGIGDDNSKERIKEWKKEHSPCKLPKVKNLSL